MKAKLENSLDNHYMYLIESNNKDHHIKKNTLLLLNV